MHEEFDKLVVAAFSEHVDAVYQTLDQLAAAIDLAAICLTQTLLNDCKLLVCGNGVSGTLGQCFTTMLLNQFEQERPSLPAIDLQAAAATISAITTGYSFAEVFSRQIHAVGQAGDDCDSGCDSL